MALERNGTPNGTMVERHKLVCATGDTNHNKYYTATLYDSGDVHIDFGRIGVTSFTGVERGAGRSFMEKKLKEKKKGKTNKETGQREPYTEIDAIDSDMGANVSSTKNIKSSSLKTIARDQIKHSSPETAKLIDFLADVNRHQISDATGGKMTWNVDKGLFQTPLGIVSSASVSEARNLLIRIGDEVAKRDWGKRSFKSDVERFMTIIPQNVGMRWNFESVFPDLQAVQKQNAILDALDASYVSATTQPTKTKKKDVVAPRVFETKLDVVGNTKVVDRINKKFRSTLNRNHYDASRMELVKAWDVEIADMSKSFKGHGSKLSNIMELWHGTQCSSVLSILKCGLIIPPASSSHCTGRLYGDGCYGSDIASKALNYATSFWGQRDIGRYFMFLVDFAMGNTYIPSRSNYTSVRYPVKGYDSTFAKAGQSGVMNNEMIVYKTNQVNIKYLLEFKRK